MTQTRLEPAKRIATFSETVFAKYTRLARQHGAVNLGQGFPDFAPPDFVLEALKEAASGYQQYAPLPGLPDFNEAAALVKGARLQRELDPVLNVQSTVGATEGLFACTQAFVNPGDEVVLLEPFYDAYPANVLMAGGVPVYVALEPDTSGNWILDLDELRKAFSDKTKAIFINSPHNPTGKVFSAEELDAIIALAHEFDALIISDEVYEYIAFSEQLSPASRPGGFERTLSISSIGKTFSVTGWKLGYVVGPSELIEVVRMAHQWITFVVASPIQAAAASALKTASEPGHPYFENLSKTFKRKHDLLVDALENTPFVATRAQGGYFVVADSSALNYQDDVALCEDLPERVGVGAIPPSAFYSDEHKHLAKHLVRFAFCKTDDAIVEAARRLKTVEDD